MRIAEFQKIHEPVDARGFQKIATFAVDVTDDVRLFSNSLVRAPDGNHYVKPPSKAALAPTYRKQILNQVSEIYNESAQRAT